MANQKISALTSASTPLTGSELVPIVQSGVTDKTTVDDFITRTVPSLTTSGDLTLNGSAKRIKGDFSNATRANRVSFLTSTANSNTLVSAIPSGTAVTSAFLVYGGSDPDNSAYGQFHATDSTHVGINSSKTGTGVTQPIVFQINGTTQASLDINGKFNFNTLVTAVTNGIGSPYSVLTTSSNGVITSEGAAAEVYVVLPSAVAGLTYTFYVQNAFGMNITASGTNTIRLFGDVTAAGGNIDCVDIGSSVTLIAINSSEWVARSATGTWTVN